MIFAVIVLVLINEFSCRFTEELRDSEVSKFVGT